MLKRRFTPLRHRRSAQRGVVLMIALIVLVAISIAAISMIRSVDTATLVTGNLTFQQAATHAADKGIEQAVAMLRKKAADGTLGDTDPTNGYSAILLPADHNPAAGQSWADFWRTSLGAGAYDFGTDAFNNHIYFVVHRQCGSTGPAGVGGNCVSSPAITKATGNSDEGGELKLNAASQVYYRITVRVLGPRKTESYVQSHIAM